MEAAYGDDYEYVSAELKPTDGPLQLSFGKEETKITGDADLVLLNPLNEELEAARITIQMELSVSVTVG